MADVVNLRHARKQRDRVAKEAAASANRRLHGQTKEEMAVARAERKRHEALLDGAKRED